MSEIRLSEVRTKNGSQSDGFEELCVQLFRKGKEEAFHRINGAGGDGGVEAYHVDSNGTKTGMQAKFFRELGDSQWSQLDSSVKSMLKNHPDSSTYEIYCPLNRTPGKDTQWNNRLKKWTRWANEAGLLTSPRYVWKGESEIFDLLTQSKYQDLANYWFKTPQFSLEWLEKNNRSSIKDLEKRYSPGQHVQTEAGRQVLAFAGEIEARTEMQDQFLGIYNSKKKFEKSYQSSFDKQPEFTPVLSESIRESISAALSFPWPEEGFPEISPLLEKGRAAIEAFDSYDRDLNRRYREINDEGKGGSDRYSHPLRSLRDSAGSLSTEQDQWIGCLEELSFIDSSFLLLSGEAGSGKSHLLADSVERFGRNKQPVLFLLGEYFTEPKEPWDQLLSIIHWGGNRDEFLSAMSIAAELRGLPAMIILDAINESDSRRLWKKYLRRFASEIAKYENVKLIVSCRSDFRTITLPQELGDRSEPGWGEITHYGFGEELLEAIKEYFSTYNIKSSSFPPILQEYRNPLFLRLFCEAFSGRELPDGPVTLQRVMQAKLDVLSEKLEQDIDCPKEDTRNAVYAAAELFSENGGQSVSRNKIRAAVDQFSPSKANSQSLYQHLKSNGIFVEIAKVERQIGNEAEVMVRFPFERFSDYFIALGMLSEIETFKELKKALKVDPKFGWIRDYIKAYENRGVLSALTIVIAEKFQEELYFLMPKKNRCGALRLAFLDSVPWRSAESFGRAPGPFLTLLIKAFFCFDRQKGRLFTYSKSKRLLFEISDWNRELFWDALLRTGSISGHPFNAELLHEILDRLSLAKRDYLWTLSITGMFEEESKCLPQQILDWTMKVPRSLVSDEQAELVGTTLFWFLSSNYRKFRKDSSIAAIRFLDKRSDVVGRLIQKFSDVNDPYVLERVFAVASGVAMREPNLSKLRKLAQAVYQTVFAHEHTNPHILLRDYALSVLEMANARDCLPDEVSPNDFRPLYASVWPEIPEESELADLKANEGWNPIFSSLAPEETGWYGDFGRYTMQYHVHQFSDRELTAGKEDPEKAQGFSAMDARRWSIKRIEELGWTPEPFARHERALFSGRMSVDQERNKMERISKKYQWIALHELLGYLSDRNFVLNQYSQERLHPYEGMSDLAGRDFDPGVSIKEKYQSESPNEAHPARENYVDPFFDPSLCADREAWVAQSPHDFAPLIGMDVTNQRADSDWLMLQMFHEFKESPFNAYKVKGEGNLRMWVHIRAWLVPTENREAFLEGIRPIHFWGNGLEMVTIRDKPLGEYPWGDDFASFSNFCEQPDNWFRELRIPHLQSVCTWEEGINTTVPSPQLLELLDLNWSGENADFVNTKGELIAKGIPGRTVALIKKEAVVTTLKNKGYDLVWGIVGERMCYDYEEHEFVVEKQREFSAVYCLEDNFVSGSLTHDICKDFPKKFLPES